MNRKKEAAHDDYDVVIIGAGICGLYLASKLSRKRFSVTVIEARPYAGGRIHTIKGALTNIQAGAEFVHGRLPLTKKLAKKARAHLVEHKGNMYRSRQGAISKAFEPVPHMKEFLKKAKALEKDITLNAFLALYFRNEKYADLRNTCRRMAEGFDAADADRVSVKSLYKEWSGDALESSYVIKEGYGSLVQYLLSQSMLDQCMFSFNEAVICLQWQVGRVSLTTQSGRVIHGKRVILTIPLYELIKPKSIALKITPALPELPVLVRQLGFGGVIKVVIEFSSFFWRSEKYKKRVAQIKDLGFMFTEGEFSIFWTSFEGLPVLTCWAGGSQASRLKNNTDKILEKKAIRTIADAFLTSEEIINNEVLSLQVFNWFNEPFIHGAYSYETPASKQSKDQLRLPIKDTLFFAGESLGRGGTVEAALESAEYTLKKIK